MAVSTYFFYALNGKLSIGNAPVVLNDTTDSDVHYITKNDDYKYLLIHAQFPNGGGCDYLVNYQILKLKGNYTATLYNGDFSNSQFYASMIIRLTYNGNSGNFYVQKTGQKIGGGINGAPYYYINAIY